ncbi:MAG: SAM-dependent methyltransferase [Rhodospirillales bacterium]|nr:SAM-dependent methyltransferase [Rhodospirillales bacterium]
MSNHQDDAVRSRHLAITRPSPWVERFAPLIPAGGRVLDVAAGNGRHARYLLGRGHAVVAADRDMAALADLAGRPNAEVIEADLETGGPVFGASGALSGQACAGIVVVNYLYRPLLAPLVQALEPHGVLIYETFARGNERFTRPRNPDHLLMAGELLELAAGRLQVVAYEHGLIEAAEIPGIKQRICAVNDLGRSTRDDDEPEPHPVPPPVNR